MTIIMISYINALIRDIIWCRMNQKVLSPCDYRWMLLSHYYIYNSSNDKVLLFMWFKRCLAHVCICIITRRSQNMHKCHHDLLLGIIATFITLISPHFVASCGTMVYNADIKPPKCRSVQKPHCRSVCLYACIVCIIYYPVHVWCATD